MTPYSRGILVAAIKKTTCHDSTGHRGTNPLAARKRMSTGRARKSTSPPPRYSTPQIIAALKANRLFTGISRTLIATIAPGIRVQHYSAGDLVFDESTRGRAVFLVASGRVRITKYGKYGIKTKLTTLRDGDFFGELSVIDSLPRNARAEVTSPSTLLLLRSEDVRRLVNANGTFALNMMKNVSTSLREMDKTFVKAIERNALESKIKLDRLNLLVEASKTVNSAIDINTLLGLILGAATRSINADRGTLYLIDAEAGEIWSKMMQGKTLVEIRLPIGKGLAGYVAQTGETVNITDAYKDPRFNPEIDRKSGYHTRNVLCMPMRDKEGKPIGVFQFLNKSWGSFTSEDESFIDALSVHAAIALENATLVQQMVQTERLSAVGRMASTIIHDIKNPMGTLRVYAQVIKKKTESPEAIRMADEMIRQVDRFVTMTQEILDFSRGVSEIKLEKVEVGEMMEAALTFVEKDLGNTNVTMIRKFDYTGPCVLDVEKMVRVFYNLAGNAGDAMPKGGTLTISTAKRNDHLVIAFEDTGSGIPEEIKSRIFEPFATFGKRHGTGLGLSIVKKIIDDHKGTIEVESRAGEGTTFRLIIPINPA